jgi:hypothetical protein
MLVKAVARRLNGGGPFLVNFCVWLMLSRVKLVRANVTLIHGLVLADV